MDEDLLIADVDGQLTIEVRCLDWHFSMIRPVHMSPIVRPASLTVAVHAAAADLQRVIEEIER